MRDVFDWVQARVSYSSTGETAELLEHVFDPSWEGKWEGLPLAYGLTRQMGGILTARHEGVYTVTFEMLLPSVEAASASVSVPSPERPVILLVEPNSAVSHRLHEWFDRQGYNVLEAANCQEALMAAEVYEGPIPLVIANPAEDDPGRKNLGAALQQLRPGVFVRLFNGRWEGHCGATSLEASASGHPAAGPELLAWVRTVLGPSPAPLSSGA